MTGALRSYIGFGLLSVTLVLVGCTSPLERTLEEALRDQLISTGQRYQQATAPGPVVELSREPSDVEAKLTPERRAELDSISGVEAYQDMALELGPDLLGQTDSPTVSMTLERATRLAIEHNLQLQLSKLGPAISQTLLTQALAQFDAVFFSDFEWAKLDTANPPTQTLFGTAFGAIQSEEVSLVTGVRKPLTTGGQIAVETGLAYNSRNPALFAVDPYYTSNIAVSINQPLLRNFGTDVARASILLNQNQLQESLQDLRTQLLDTLIQVEQAYWDLVFARQRLLIQRRLLQRTIEDRDRLEARAPFDVTQVRLTEANSFVELRRAAVIRARQQVRVASDALKRLINAPELSVASEVMIVPLNRPAEAPLQFSLQDAVMTALRQRPELRRALLEINDASIRQRVADNLRLPRLDLTGTIRYNGWGNGLDDSYDMTTDGDFIDYIIGLAFEVPIGNRGPEALYKQRRLERRASVINYRNQAQQVVLEVKNSLRDLIATYELIGATRAARRAAADNLRAIEEQERAGVALTPEFLLDLKLSAQERLADAESQEIQALTDYNVAIANLYRTMGTLLEYNRIDFDPAAQPTR